MFALFFLHYCSHLCSYAFLVSCISIHIYSNQPFIFTYNKFLSFMSLAIFAYVLVTFCLVFFSSVLFNSVPFHSVLFWKYVAIMFGQNIDSTKKVPMEWMYAKWMNGMVLKVTKSNTCMHTMIEIESNIQFQTKENINASQSVFLA